MEIEEDGSTRDSECGSEAGAAQERSARSDVCAMCLCVSSPSGSRLLRPCAHQHYLYRHVSRLIPDLENRCYTGEGWGWRQQSKPTNGASQEPMGEGCVPRGTGRDGGERDTHGSPHVHRVAKISLKLCLALLVLLAMDIPVSGMLSAHTQTHRTHMPQQLCA